MSYSEKGGGQWCCVLCWTQLEYCILGIMSREKNPKLGKSRKGNQFSQMVSYVE